MSEDLKLLAQSLSVKDDETRKLGGALKTGMQFNPDEYAKAIRTSAQTGVDPQAVLKNQKAFDASVMASPFEPGDLINMSPKVARWLVESVDHAPVAHDDLDALTRFERAAMDAGSQILQIPQRAMGGLFRAIGGGAFLTGSIMEAGLKPNASLWEKIASRALDPTGNPEQAEFNKRLGKDIREYYRPLFEDSALVPNTTSGRIAGFVGNIAGTMGKAVLSGPAAPAVFGAEALGEGGGAALERGATPGQATVKAVGSGVLNTALAFIPGGKFGSEQGLAKAFMEGGKWTISKEVAKGLGARAVRGTVLGTTVTGVENLLSRVYDPKTPLMEGWSDNVASFIGLEGAGYLAHAVKLSSESKLKARSPEVFKNAAEAILKDSGLEQVMVPSSRFETFFQEAGMDPAKMAEELGAKNYVEALASGTDVVLPMADALAKLSTEHLNRLLPDMRLSSDQMTLREAQAYQQDAPARVSRMVEEARIQLPEDHFQTFYEIKAEIQSRLESTGRFSPALAEDNAALLARGLVNQGLREGLDPLKMMEGYGLSILGPETPRPAGQTFTQPGDARGSITFGPDNKVSIAVLEKANASTFVHELGHFWLKMQADLAQRPEATAQLKEDLATILKARGKTSLKQFTVEDHEWMARAHEAYLREGKAPTPELQGTFSRFKTWLRAIYRRLKDLNVGLTDEVRGVFDRVYATDAEIEAARGKLEGERPLFDSAEKAGMTEAEFETYGSLRGKEEETAKASLDAQLRAEEDRTRLQWWNDELGKVREEVAAQVDAEPAYRAFRALSEGKTGDGIGIKLNRDSLIREFGEDALKALPHLGVKWVYSREGGMDAGAAAEILGFDSGSHLIETLKGMAPREERIRAGADQIMKQRHGDMLTDGSIAEAALAAVHNQTREARLMLELKSLRKKQQEVVRGKAEARATLKDIPHIQTFRDAARELVDQASIRSLDPYRYIIASRKASRESFEALAKGHFAIAGDAKQREILNHHLFLEATKARAEAAGIYRYGRDAQREAVQSILGKAGGDFQAQFNQILQSVEFAKVTNKSLDARTKSLADWVAEQRANDAAIAFDAASIPTKNWRELSRVELRAVGDALANIETIARALVNRTREGKTVEYDALVEEFDRKTLNRRKETPKSGSSLGIVEKLKKAVRAVDSNLLKMEWLVDRLDNQDIDGPARVLLLDPINKGQVRFEEVQHQVLKEVSKVVLARPKADQQGGLEGIGIRLPGFDRDLNRKQAVSLLFNMGTEENRNATIGGYKLINGDGSIAPELTEAFSKLRASEIRYVQGIWDVLESFWPMDSAFQKRVTGIEPERKTLTPFSVTSVEGEVIPLRGGYFPLVGASEGRVNRMQEGMDLSQIFSEGWTAPSTSKSRFHKVSGATYEVMLDHEYILTRHMDKMARDYAFREPAFQVAHALRDPRVSKIIQETVGVEYERELMTWLKDTVNGDRVSLQDKNDVFLKGALNRRGAISAAALGFNIATTLKQVTDPLKALPLLGNKSHYLVTAFAKVRLNPSKVMAEIREMSPEVMRYREENFSRELRQIVESKSAFDKRRQNYSAAGFAMLGAMDRYNAFPIWLALFDKAMDDTGGNKAKAIRIADRDANMVLQAGRIKDNSPMFRKRGWTQVFTMFGNEMNTYYNLISGMVGRKDAPGVGLALFAASASAVIGKAIAGQMPEDPEKRGGWLLRNAGLAPLETVPFVADAAKALVDVNTGGKADIQYSPVVSAFVKPAKASKAFADAWGEEDTFKNWAALLDAADAAGTWFGVEGTAQLMKSGRYLNKVQAGIEHPETKAEAARKAVLGAPPKR